MHYYKFDGTTKQGLTVWYKHRYQSSTAIIFQHNTFTDTSTVNSHTSKQRKVCTRRMKGLSCRQCKALLFPVWRIHYCAYIWFFVVSNLFFATGAIVIFMPEAIHWREKKANSKHHRHHATHNSCQTWLWSDVGDTGTTTVDAIERSRGVSVYGLLERNAFWIADDDVWRDGSGLVWVYSGVVRDPDHRFLLLPDRMFILLWHFF